MNEKKHEKNYGIEWLRILSMYMVAVLHTLGQGGIIGSFKQGDLSFSIAWFLEIAAFGAVDCFALISGYVGYHSHFRYKKGLRIWFQTFFLHAWNHYFICHIYARSCHKRSMDCCLLSYHEKAILVYDSIRWIIYFNPNFKSCDCQSFWKRAS